MDPAATAAATRDSAPSQNPQFSRLPAALLTRILQCLPQQERLSSCATVCTSWAAAATAATVEVDRSDATAVVIAAFQPWLKQHAGQLVSLRLKLPERMAATMASQLPKFTLPCSKLQQLSRLDLAGVRLQLGSATDASNSSRSSSSSSSSTATAAMLPKLKVLKLQDCINTCTLPAVAQLSGLTRFKLVGTCQMVHETQFEPAALQHLLQGLPKLAHLSLECTGDPSGLIRVLPADSLTALSLGPCYGGTRPELPGSMSRLVNLRKLKLSIVKLDPAALSSITLLTHLQLQECRMNAGSASVFPAAVRGMRQLQHLSLVSQLDAMKLETAQPRGCAALTAASQLTCLMVFCYNAQPLPATAVQHMFPPGKQFPPRRLQQVSIAGGTSVGPVTTAELRSIISACPALCGLDIGCVLTEDVDVSVLLQLPATCCSLKVGGKLFGDDAAGWVAQRTQLTRLQWTFAPGLTDAGLQPLTALSALQALRLFENDNLGVAVVDVDEDDLGNWLELVAAEQSVSQQLRELLLSTPTSAAWLTRVEQQQQIIAEQQDRLHALSCFTAQLADVLMFCAGNRGSSQTMVTVRRMADTGRLLVGGEVEAGGDHGALQRYLQLHGRVLKFCAKVGTVPAALASMEAAVKRYWWLRL